MNRVYLVEEMIEAQASDENLLRYDPQFTE
jgi:hypothetical protein